MSSAAPTSERELVLQVMLAADERVMLIQTSCLQTIGDLKKYIYNEYARLFPHLPALSQDVLIQKRMSRALVMEDMDHRANLRDDSSHGFVDLANNVQAGNVFQNREQIYIVPNTSNGKLAAVKKGGDKKVEKIKKDDANKGESNKPTEEKSANKVLKKSAPKKSQNALLHQMRALKQNPSESSAALLVNSLRDKERAVSGPHSQSDWMRKARQNDVVTEASETACPMPPSKKQKTIKLDKTSKSSREKGTGTKTISDEGLTASKIMPTSPIVQKKMDKSRRPWRLDYPALENCLENLKRLGPHYEGDDDDDHNYEDSELDETLNTPNKNRRASVPRLGAG
ncbi:hypothetical protein PsorP6_010663 [Peronosclerospora sorghi]|uniref:Uncharacterized protein n=1 Tax=Peronosclerospora sorghi TaxID=230839 RepID=A0ACC0VTV3_9STRA|nr:hypothetical protein PsorP6_010663 [Peronosclerospora sorghi]